jgi:hypothetical protein
VEDDDAEARAYLIAHELIEQHGDDVARFLQAKIDEVMGARDLEQLSAWFVIRNAVTLTLEAETKLH